jgi:hypothetical protein
MDIQAQHLKSSGEVRARFNKDLSRIRELDNSKADQDEKSGSVKIQGDGQTLEARFTDGFLSSTLEEKVTQGSRVTISRFEKGVFGPVKGESYSKGPTGHTGTKLTYHSSSDFHSYGSTDSPERGFLVADARFQS